MVINVNVTVDNSITKDKHTIDCIYLPFVAMRESIVQFRGFVCIAESTYEIAVQSECDGATVWLTYGARLADY